MQVIYDAKGIIFMQGSGFPKPEGELVCADFAVPDNKYITSIDTSKTPAEPVYADYPKSEMQILKDQLEETQANLDYLMLLAEAEG